MKKILLIVMTGMMMACGNKPAGNSESVEDSTSVASQEEEVVAPSKEPSIRETCSFSTQFRKDENGQCDALIISCRSDKMTQEFTCEFNWAKDEEFLGGSGEYEEVDLNFDGVPDLLVYLGNFGINSPLEFYAAFIWDETIAEFKQAKELEHVVNIVVDKEKKVLVSEYSTMVGDDYHEVYAWKDGKFEMIEKTVHNEYDDEE